MINGKYDFEIPKENQEFLKAGAKCTLFTNRKQKSNECLNCTYSRVTSSTKSAAPVCFVCVKSFYDDKHKNKTKRIIDSYKK